jgi:hypothetical protein
VDKGATATGAGEKKNLKIGETEYLITVRYGGKTQIYTVTVNRSAEKSGNAYLDKLVATGGNGVMTTKFKKETTDYTFVVDSSATEVYISAAPEHPYAKLKAGSVGTKKLRQYADTTFVITVVAENQDVTQAYNLTVKFGKPSTIVVPDDDATSVETLRAASLQIYPNPTTGIVHVDNPDGNEIALYDARGALLLRTTGATIDISQYPVGIYFLREGKRTAKVVKK